MLEFVFPDQTIDYAWWWLLLSDLQIEICKYWQIDESLGCSSTFEDQFQSSFIWNIPLF